MSGKRSCPRPLHVLRLRNAQDLPRGWRKHEGLTRYRNIIVFYRSLHFQLITWQPGSCFMIRPRNQQECLLVSSRPPAHAPWARPSGHMGALVSGLEAPLSFSGPALALALGLALGRCLGPCLGLGLGLGWGGVGRAGAQHLLPPPSLLLEVSTCPAPPPAVLAWHGPPL